MINVMPVEDWIDHTEDTTCSCQPEVIFENGEMIIIHNAADGRKTEVRDYGG